MEIGRGHRGKVYGLVLSVVPSVLLTIIICSLYVDVVSVFSEHRLPAGCRSRLGGKISRPTPLSPVGWRVNMPLERH